MQSVGGCPRIFKDTAAWPCGANSLLTSSPTGFLAPNRMLFPDGQQGVRPVRSSRGGGRFHKRGHR